MEHFQLYTTRGEKGKIHLSFTRRPLYYVCGVENNEFTDKWIPAKEAKVGEICKKCKKKSNYSVKRR